MKNRKTILVLLTVLLIGLCSFSTDTNYTGQPGAWEHLGSKKVNFGLDHDVIIVTAAEGAFSKLRLKVTAGSLNMHRMVIVYGNGTRDEINIRHNFTQGSATRVIDLKGNKRIIRKVIFWYDTKNMSGRRATLHLFGRH